MLRYSIASSPYRLSSALRQRATAQLLAVPLATSRIPVHRVWPSSCRDRIAPGRLFRANIVLQLFLENIRGLQDPSSDKRNACVAVIPVIRSPGERPQCIADTAKPGPDFPPILDRAASETTGR